MSDIYNQHNRAFAHVSAFVVMRGGDRVATIAFKFPRDGAGRLYAYVHWLGTEMVRGYASGGGYDKKTAACSAAVARFYKHPDCEKNIREHASAHLSGFLYALKADRGPAWDTALREAGFTVWQAV